MALFSASSLSGGSLALSWASSTSSAVEFKPHSCPRNVAKKGQCSTLGDDGFLRIECSRREMLSVSTKTFRAKAAILVAALYMLCILAPSAAFAFSANPGVAHCLTEGHVGVHDHGGKAHLHADGTGHTTAMTTPRPRPATMKKPAWQRAVACSRSWRSLASLALAWDFTASLQSSRRFRPTT
jgi:hypothetical protein